MPAALRGTTNAADKRTTSGAAAKPRSAGAACRRTPDPAGAGGLFCAGPGLRHLCTVAGAAGVDAHAHGHGGVRRLAGIRTGQPSAGSILAAVGLSDGAHDPGAASVLRPGHAGALQGLRSAQLLHDLCHERRDLSITCSAEPPEGGQGLVHVLHYPAGSVLLGGQRGAGGCGGLHPALQHRRRGFCDDGHVHGHLPEPVGKGQAALQRPHRHCGPAGVLAVFGSGSFLLPAMACILVLLLALRKPIEKAEGTEADKRKEETGV